MNPVSRVVCCCKPFKRPFSHITPSKDFGQIVPVTWLTGQSIEAMAHGEFVDFFLLLVGGLKASPLKNMMKVNGDDEIPNINMGKFINWWQPNHQPAICILLIFHYYSIDFPLMFQTTNQSMKMGSNMFQFASPVSSPEDRSPWIDHHKHHHHNHPWTTINHYEPPFSSPWITLNHHESPLITMNHYSPLSITRH